MEHDGAIDDILSQLILLTMENIELIGVNVTPADSFLEPAVESTYKVLQLFDKVDVPIGVCTERGVNAFPSEWRARPEIINVLPMLINLPYDLQAHELPSGHELLAQSILKQSDAVSILITGPCTNLVKAVEEYPAIKSKIDEVVWMGGAFRTQGNVQTYQHDGSAEWNVYWDPYSSKRLFEMELPLVCIPLDVTNQVPVDKSFLSRLARQASSNISNLAGQLWAMTIDTIPSYHYTYYMWDTLATCYLALKEEFQLEKVKALVSDLPPNAGHTILDADGHEVTIATNVNKEIFYDYLLRQLNQDPAIDLDAFRNDQKIS